MTEFDPAVVAEVPQHYRSQLKACTPKQDAVTVALSTLACGIHPGKTMCVNSNFVSLCKENQRTRRTHGEHMQL